MKLKWVIFSVTFEHQRNDSLILATGQLLMFDQWNSEVELYGRGSCTMEKIADWWKK
jgi:hypothetical protein